MPFGSAKSSKGRRGSTSETDKADTVRPGASSGVWPKQGVLLVDDDPALTKSLTRALLAAGVEVTSVPDGAQAVEHLLSGEFEVVLSDIHMPNMTGIELLRVVSSYDLDVPVILMTGEPEVDTAIEALDRGAMSYLRKPTPVPAILGAIERAREAYRSSRERRASQTMPAVNGEGASNKLLTQHFDKSLQALTVVFQPIVTRRGRLLGYEALMRSEGSPLATPPALIGAAERLNRLHQLGRRVRLLAASAFDHAPSDALLFVNLHPRDLLDPELYDPSGALASIADRVVLEITERADLDTIEDAYARISVLRYQGYRIAIDDLGAGHSGLTAFASMEPDIVKLDMGLVRGIDGSQSRQRVVRAMVSMCKGLGMDVVAEGVETNAEKMCLFELGVDFQQGYLFAKPSRAFVRPLSFE
jgi:EAL domain-containing protein (putative c-di-GMP-specific phosphodiesterase class I)/CheY-like chemotaxis protein